MGGLFLDGEESPALEDISKWTVEDVCSFVSNLSGCTEYTQVNLLTASRTSREECHPCRPLLLSLPSVPILLALSLLGEGISQSPAGPEVFWFFF